MMNISIQDLNSISEGKFKDILRGVPGEITVNKWIHNSSILKDNTYSDLDFNNASRVYSIVENDVDLRNLDTFLSKNNFCINPHRYAFKKEITIKTVYDKETKLQHLGKCSAFDNYIKKLNKVCSLIWESMESPYDLLDIKEGDFSSFDESVQENIEVSYKIKRFINLNHNLKYEFELAEKFYRYRRGRTTNDNSAIDCNSMTEEEKIDITSLTEDELLTKYFQMLMKKAKGNKAEVARKAGISNSQIYEGKRKKYIDKS